MRYVLALVAGVFLMNYATTSRMFTKRKMNRFKKMMFASMPMMQYRRLRKAYR